MDTSKKKLNHMKKEKLGKNNEVKWPNLFPVLHYCHSLSLFFFGLMPSFLQSVPQKKKATGDDTLLLMPFVSQLHNGEIILSLQLERRRSEEDNTLQKKVIV